MTTLMSDTSFIQQFTTSALNQMVSSHLDFANQFTAENFAGYGALDMFDTQNHGTPKPQWTTFANMIAQYYAPNAITPTTLTPIPTVSLTNTPTPTLALTPTPQQSGATVCSSSTNQQCSYRSTCSYADGTLCENNVSCNNGSSANNVYVCQGGQWVYQHWIAQGTCNFCANVTPTLIPSSKYSIYYDALNSNWSSNSWGSRINLSNTSPVFSGTRSITFTATSAWGGLSFYNNAGINTKPYAYLYFAMQASKNNQSYAVMVSGNNNQWLTQLPLTKYGGNPVPGSWKQYKIPLADLNATAISIKSVCDLNHNVAESGALYFTDERALYTSQWQSES